MNKAGTSILRPANKPQVALAKAFDATAIPLQPALEASAGEFARVDGQFIVGQPVAIPGLGR
jgi:hypothetical protein